MTVTEQLTRESFVDSGAIAKMHAYLGRPSWR
jgi:hypothetical protein